MSPVSASFGCWVAGVASAGETVDFGAEAVGEVVAEAPASEAPVSESRVSSPEGSSHHSRIRAPASEAPVMLIRTPRRGARRRTGPTGAVTG